MKNDLTEILGDALPQELVASLQEAFDQKVADARDEIELEVREDFARRYEVDRTKLIEAIDAMVTDAVTTLETERGEETKKLAEARVKYHTSMVEGRKAQVKHLAESIDRAKGIIAEQLTKEIVSLREQKAAAIREAMKLAEELKDAKREIAEQHVKHVKKIDEFVTRQVRKELVEFAEDKKALVESRVKLVAESRSKLKATQTKFIAEAAKKVDAMINDRLTVELTQLHEDLERNRQNMFGRRIFEAVAAEFMTSYLAEGTEVRKLQKVLEGKEAEIAEKAALAEAAQTRIDEAVAAKDAADRKATLALEGAERSKLMSELLGPLKGDKRSVMENLLETTKTSALRRDFDKYLPMVLNEGRGKAATETAVLSETRVAPPVKTRPASGDALRNNRLLESQASETQESPEIAHIVRLSGLGTK